MSCPAGQRRALADPTACEDANLARAKIGAAK